ncbi:MAG: J domain-containing protein [Acidobacteria bacterium]|nr:J domain-containing protein [Acidobacteriota bacterium]
MKLGLKHSYEIFQLGPDATPEQVKQVYRDLVKKWHPDRFGHDPKLQKQAQEKFIEINEAYELLRNISPNEARIPQYRKAAPPPTRAPSPVTPRRPFSGRGMRFQSPQESNRFGRMQATPALTIILVAVFALCSIIYAKLTMPPVYHPSTNPSTNPSTLYEHDTKLKISWQKLEALKHLDQAKEFFKDGKLDDAAFECDLGLRMDSENIDLLKLKLEIKEIQLNETPKNTPPEK